MSNNSSRRAKAREAERKFFPAIKAISEQLHNTGTIPNEFIGYEMPAGTVKGHNNVEWQLQIRAVCANSKKLNKNQIYPIISDGMKALILKSKVFLKHLVDKIYEK